MWWLIWFSLAFTFLSRNFFADNNRKYNICSFLSPSFRIVPRPLKTNFTTFRHVIFSWFSDAGVKQEKIIGNVVKFVFARKQYES